MLIELDELPPNEYLVKADARKMYTCIDTTHGLAILRQFLEELEARGVRRPLRSCLLAAAQPLFDPG